MQAKQTFFHGRQRYEVGDTVEVSKGEADDLHKAGLIGEEDLLGGHDEKMAPEVKNKMEKPAANKHTK